MTTVQVPPTGDRRGGQPQPVVPARRTDARAGRRGRRRRVGRGSRASRRFVAYTLLIVGSIVFLIPFYFVFNASLKGQAEVEAGDFSRPVVLPPRSRGRRS